MSFLAPLLALLPEGIASLFAEGAVATELGAAGAAAASAAEGAAATATEGAVALANTASLGGIASGLAGKASKGISGFLSRNKDMLISQGINAGGLVIPQVMMMHSMNKQASRMNESLSGMSGSTFGKQLVNSYADDVFKNNVINNKDNPLWMTNNAYAKYFDALRYTKGQLSGQYTPMAINKDAIALFSPLFSKKCCLVRDWIKAMIYN